MADHTPRQRNKEKKNVVEPPLVWCWAVRRKVLCLVGAAVLGHFLTEEHHAGVELHLLIDGFAQGLPHRHLQEMSRRLNEGSIQKNLKFPPSWAPSR